MPFNEIIGQDKAVSFLKARLHSGGLAGAYLFSGAQGVGKFMAARIFAKAVNCLGKEGDSCGSCASCIKIEKGIHPDVHLIEAQKGESISIEEARQLKDRIALRPYEAKYKVFLIDNAHKLSSEAANALLKVLEEPAAQSMIILISAAPALLPKTVLSRCRTVKFAPLKREELENILSLDYRLDRESAHFLAYFYEGRIGPALELKDSDVLREKNRIIDIFAVSKRPETDNLARKSSREDIRGYLNSLAAWLRDIYLLKAGVSFGKLINIDRRQELLSSMNRVSWAELAQAFKAISDSFFYLEQNLNQKLILAHLRANLWR